MNNVVKANTQITYEQYKKFALYHAFKQGRGLSPAIIISCTLTIICLFLFFSMLVIDGFDIILFGLTVFAVYLQIVRIIGLFYKIRKNYGAMKESGARTLYSFSPDTVKVETLSTTITGQSELKYEAFKSVVESRDSFYLYVSKKAALILPMSDITEGTAGMLSALLREKTGSRHIFSY